MTNSSTWKKRESLRLRNQQTLRFEQLQRLPAIALLLATVALIVLGLILDLAPIDADANKGKELDSDLYVAVAQRVAGGEDYYSAAAAEHRERGYPLRPFVTVREPTLAYATAWVGDSDRMVLIMAALAFAALAAMVWRMERVARSRATWWSAGILLALTVGPLVGQTQSVIHEAWAGILIVVSLAFRSERRFVASVCLGLLAVLIRELALPYLVIMGLLAWRDGKRREAWAWAAAIMAFVIAFATHAVLVGTHSGSVDRASQGWVSFGGWEFILDLVRRASFLGLMPGWVVAVVVPLALLGWLSRRAAMTNRVIVTIGVFICAFLVVGRPENTYWGLMFVALLMPGLAFGPGALRGLILRIRRPVGGPRSHNVQV